MELTTSIDNLLYDFSGVPEIQTIGKLAITSAILKAENNCVLGDSYKKREFKDTLEGTWYFSLFSELNKKASLITFVERLKNIYFIIFNYDRTIEQYFYNSIKNFYKASTDQAAEIVNNMNIYHPYGQTGYLQFQKGTIKNNFGRIHEDDISEISSLIKTFMLDNFIDDDEYLKARSFLYNADKVFFLGFAYHKQNLDLLFDTMQKYNTETSEGNRIPLSNSYYYGTFFEESEFNKNTIINDLKNRNRRIKDFFASDKKCVAFFAEISRAIEF